MALASSTAGSTARLASCVRPIWPWGGFSPRPMADSVAERTASRSMDTALSACVATPSGSRMSARSRCSMLMWVWFRSCASSWARLRDLLALSENFSNLLPVSPSLSFSSSVAFAERLGTVPQRFHAHEQTSRVACAVGLLLLVILSGVSAFPLHGLSGFWVGDEGKSTSRPVQARPGPSTRPHGHSARGGSRRDQSPGGGEGSFRAARARAWSRRVCATSSSHRVPLVSLWLKSVISYPHCTAVPVVFHIVVADSDRYFFANRR